MAPVDAAASGVGMRGLADLIDGSQLEVVADCGHFLVIEHAQTTADLISQFVRRSD